MADAHLLHGLALISLLSEHDIWLMHLQKGLALISLLPDHPTWLMHLFLYGLALISLVRKHAIWLMLLPVWVSVDISHTRACHMADAAACMAAALISLVPEHAAQS
jgi:hypothetical protein